MRPNASFPSARPRRLRTTPAIRRLVAETRLHPAGLIQPLFVAEGLTEPRPLTLMPGVVQHSLSIEPTVVQSLRALMDTGERLNEHDAVALMQQTYPAFVHDNSSRFGVLFSHLLDSHAPLVFHCTAGKDRTGFGAAMILAALGVAEHDILEDYLLSARYFPIEREIERVRRKYAGGGGKKLDVDQILPMMQSRAGNLRAGFDEIARTHGTSERFLADALGIGEMELRVLRERYTA